MCARRDAYEIQHEDGFCLPDNIVRLFGLFPLAFREYYCCASDENKQTYPQTWILEGQMIWYQKKNPTDEQENWT